MTIKIRKFRSEDLNRVLEITRASFLRPWPKKEFEKYLEDSFVAEEDGKVVGFIVGATLENQGIIKLTAVEQNYRGKGIGKKLIEFILEHFKEKDVKEIMARSRTQNTAGISFLKTFGFEITKTIENYYPNGNNAYLMKKKLEGE